MLADAYREVHNDALVHNGTKVDGIRADGSFGESSVKISLLVAHLFDKVSMVECSTMETTGKTSMFPPSFPSDHPT